MFLSSSHQGLCQLWLCFNQSGNSIISHKNQVCLYRFGLYVQPHPLKNTWMLFPSLPQYMYCSSRVHEHIVEYYCVKATCVCTTYVDLHLIRQKTDQRIDLKPSQQGQLSPAVFFCSAATGGQVAVLQLPLSQLWAVFPRIPCVPLSIQQGPNHIFLSGIIVHANRKDLNQIQMISIRLWVWLFK